MQAKQYLGDGVYAEFDGFYIWLYTSNGLKESDRIALEPEVFAQLEAYAKRLAGRDVRSAQAELEDGL